MKMYYLFGISIALLMPHWLYAADLNFTCPARTEGVVRTEGYIQFSAYKIGPSKSLLRSIQYIHRDLEPDGSYKEISEDLYSQFNRGGHTVSYCNPDTNEFLEDSGKFNLYSICSTPPTTGYRVNFSARFSTSEVGSIRISALGNSEHLERHFLIEPCSMQRMQEFSALEPRMVSPKLEEITPFFLQGIARRALSTAQKMLPGARLNVIEARQIENGECTGHFDFVLHFAGEEPPSGITVKYLTRDKDCLLSEASEASQEGVGFLMLDPQLIAVELKQALATVKKYFPNFQWDGALYAYHQLDPRYPHPFYSLNGTMEGQAVGFTLDATTGDILLGANLLGTIFAE